MLNSGPFLWRKMLYQLNYGVDNSHYFLWKWRQKFKRNVQVPYVVQCILNTSWVCSVGRAFSESHMAQNQMKPYLDNCNQPIWRHQDGPEQSNHLICMALKFRPYIIKLKYRTSMECPCHPAIHHTYARGHTYNVGHPATWPFLIPAHLCVEVTVWWVFWCCLWYA